MSYLVLLPCLLFVFYAVKRERYPAVFFVTGTLLLAVLIASSGIMTPGADTLLATSLAMCGFHLAKWYWGPAAQDFSESSEVPVEQEARPFCAQRTHDFALSSSDTDFAIDLLEAEQWVELTDALAKLDDAERQGFYANFDYSRLSSLSPVQLAEHGADDGIAKPGNCLIKFTNAQPHSADAHVLYGHYQLCEAKRMGLRPGIIPNADSAGALAIAFRHFRLALRIDPDNPEALCGLILAKGFTGLSSEHIEKSLQRLLEVDALHFHGLVAAAFFLVNSTAEANRFVSIVERTVGEKNVTAAFARIVVHVECMIGVDARPSLQTRMIADLHTQLRVYHTESAKLGQWQQGICNNIVAFAFERIGDDRERALYLEKVKGLLSPYPWRCSQTAIAGEAASAVSSSSTSA